MKKKAEKLLGYEFYFKLSPLTGKELTPKEHPEEFAELMKVQQTINAGLDETLRRHGLKIDEIERQLTGSEPEITDEEEE